eukprot:TRINITY_DN1783_c0_g1_i2.p1 TRINITY_DN1783_c0_g1~~TRINITY_DN1783_c0_g1_i2.p1  ORF type:complete len:510 (-),score=76.72 TRINITY_DN1783_c0_g1_i2:127-1584(-)
MENPPKRRKRSKPTDSIVSFLREQCAWVTLDTLRIHFENLDFLLPMLQSDDRLQYDEDQSSFRFQYSQVKLSEKIKDVVQLLCMVRERVSCDYIFQRLGVDVRTEPGLLESLKKFASYDERDETLYYGVLEFIHERGNTNHRQVTIDDILVKLGNITPEEYKLLGKHPCVERSGEGKLEWRTAAPDAMARFIIENILRERFGPIDSITLACEYALPLNRLALDALKNDQHVITQEVEEKSVRRNGAAAEAKDKAKPLKAFLFRYNYKAVHIAQQKKCLIQLIRISSKEGIDISEIFRRTEIDLTDARTHGILLQSLTASEKIQREGNRFFYKPKFAGVHTAQQLEGVINRHPLGLPRLELEDTYVGADKDLDNILSRKGAISILNTEKKEDIIYPYVPPVHLPLDEDLQDMWVAVQLPSDAVSLDRELHRAGLISLEELEGGHQLRARQKMPSKRNSQRLAVSSTSSRRRPTKLTNTHLISELPP